MLDGEAAVNLLKPIGVATFADYANQFFKLFIERQPKDSTRIDIVWDECIPDSLKASTRTKREISTRRRVFPNSETPGNWQLFLRLEENKQELFKFLVATCIPIESQCTMYSTIENSAVTNVNYDLSFIATSNQEEQSGMKKVLICTVDTNVAVKSIGVFEQLNLSELWLFIKTGKHLISRNAHDHSSSCTWKVERPTTLPCICWMCPSLVE